MRKVRLPVQRLSRVLSRVVPTPTASQALMLAANQYVGGISTVTETKTRSTVSITESSVRHSGFQDTLPVPALQNTASPAEITLMAQR